MQEDHPYFNLEPQEIWRHFAALNEIPRPSGEEEAAREYVRQIADKHGFNHRTDARGNLVVYVPATKSGDAQPVVLQSHLDMVCQHRPHVQHDWSRDPVVPRRVGDRIYATDTTLGADNGMGVAPALALMTTPNLKHGPLELLFTIEEETGLHGAAELDADLISSRRMINLDGKGPGELMIGCAGGAGVVLQLPLETEPLPEGFVAREIIVTGLSGGHSGVQIHEPLANAIKLLIEVLRECGSAIDFRLISIEGGTAHNAIARDATAQVVLFPRAAEEITQAISMITQKLCAQWCESEPKLEVNVRDLDAPAQVWSDEDTDRVLRLLDQLPHGVLAMSQEFSGKVETSTNLAQVESDANGIKIATSSRSFLDEALREAQQNVCAIGDKFGATTQVRDGYPGWTPQPDSPLLQTAIKVHEKLYDAAPEIEIIHAGLECGVLAERLPGLEAISFGPDINNQHSPDEYVEITSVAEMWKLLTALLEELADAE